jgi:hypothetical protein
MTPILVLVPFLLVLDVLALVGRSHDSRDGRDWQPRGSPSPGPSAVAPHLTIRPLSSRFATAEPSWTVRHRASVADHRILAALGGRGLGSEE